MRLIKSSDFRFDTHQNAAVGGMHTNMVDSRITVIHVPTAWAESCNEYRSTIANRGTALGRLADRLKADGWLSESYIHDSARNLRERLDPALATEYRMARGVADPHEIINAAKFRSDLITFLRKLEEA